MVNELFRRKTTKSIPLSVLEYISLKSSPNLFCIVLQKSSHSQFDI